MNRWSPVLLGLLLFAGLGLATPSQAKEKLPDTDLSGLAVLLGGEAAPPAIPVPTTAGGAATTRAPAPDTGGLTLDRFALGFGLVVVGTLGAAVAMLLLRRMRRLVNTTLAQQPGAGEKKNP